VSPVAFAPVFEHPQECSPRRASAVSGVSRQFDQPSRVQVLYGHEVVFSCVVVRQLVKEVAAFSFEVGVTFGHDLPLFFPVRRTVFFP